MLYEMICREAGESESEDAIVRLGRPEAGSVMDIGEAELECLSGLIRDRDVTWVAKKPDDERYLLAAGFERESRGGVESTKRRVG
jgi:hypothetical protein